MKVTVEYIRWLQTQRTKINSVPLDEIEFYENGKPLIISSKIIDDFKFVGLVNTDFILTGHYKTGLCQKDTVDKDDLGVEGKL